MIFCLRQNFKYVVLILTIVSNASSDSAFAELDRYILQSILRSTDKNTR